MVIFDTNALLRYVLQDIEEMANSVENVINTSSCVFPVEVVAEMVYVLSKVYKIQRNEIALTIKGIIDIENITVPESDVVVDALDVFSDTKLDFVDCLMIGYAKSKNYSVFTFDDDLKKVLNTVTRRNS